MDFLTNINDIKTCELISLHTPLTSNSKYPTKNMLDSNFIEILKNKILINTSRGGIVDESSVLRNKDLIYISDVWNNEPVPNKTLVDRSLIATPHIAGHSFNGKLNGTIILIKNLLKYIDREDRIKDSLEIINNHFSLVKRRQQAPSFNDYFLEYDVNWESQRFKTSFEVADKESYESIFNDLRSKHPLRRDFL
jgi:erythronate-4-phosphate dehydrogenase